MKRFLSRKVLVVAFGLGLAMLLVDMFLLLRTVDVIVQAEQGVIEATEKVVAEGSLDEGPDEVALQKHLVEHQRVFEERVDVTKTSFIWRNLAAIFLLGLIFLLVLFQVRQREKVGHELEQAKDQLSTILDATNVLIYLKDPDGKYLFVNRCFADVFHVDRDATIGKTVHDIFPQAQADSYRENDQQVIESKESLTVDLVTEPDGETHTYLNTKMPLQDKDGKLYAICGVATDITERKELEALKDRFFNAVSHELRTPLTPIHQFSTILADGLAGDVTKQQKEYLEIILRNVNQLKGIISDLLDISRLQTAKLSIEPQRVDPLPLLETVLEGFTESAKQKKIKLAHTISSSQMPIWVDPLRLEQIVRNLLDNAIKFTPEGGEVFLEVVPERAEPGSTCFSVQDSGKGIPPEDRQKIFKRLYQTEDRLDVSRKGLGLGLHICDELVARQGGKIWVEGGEKKGSRFFFTLPLFSLDRILSPVLHGERGFPLHLGMIGVSASIPKKILSETIRNEIRNKVRAHLLQCILPGDFLLPTMNGNHEFFVLVRSEEAGVRVVTKRINEGSLAADDLVEGGIELQVSYEMVGLPTKGEQSVISPPDLTRMISSTIERMIHGSRKERKGVG